MAARAAGLQTGELILTHCQHLLASNITLQAPGTVCGEWSAFGFKGVCVCKPDRWACELAGDPVRPGQELLCWHRSADGSQHNAEQ